MRETAVAEPARLGALWFGIQAVWSALLGVFLQSRVVEFAGADAVRAYAWLAAGGALLAAAVQVGVGFFSDRRYAVRGHRRETYVAGAAIAVPALVAFFAAPAAAGFVFAFAALQVGMNVLGGPYQAAVPDSISPGAAGRASAWMSVHQFCGSIAGLAVAAALRGVAAGIALALLLGAGFAVTFAHLRALPPAATRASGLRIDRDVATVLLSRGAINVGFYTLFGFLFFFVRESLHVTDARTTTGVLFLVFTAGGVAGAALAGRASDRFDKRLVVTIAAAAIAIAVAAFAAAPSVPVALVAAAASGAAWGAFFTADWAIAYLVLPRGAMAAAMGIWNLASTLPQVVAPAITAPLVTAFDARQAGLGPRVALVAVIVEFIVGTAWLWRLDPQRLRG